MKQKDVQKNVRSYKEGLNIKWYRNSENETSKAEQYPNTLKLQLESSLGGGLISKSSTYFIKYNF